MTEQQEAYYTNNTFDVAVDDLITQGRETLHIRAPDLTIAERLDCLATRIELLEQGLRSTCERLARLEQQARTETHERS
jgi:hypothetical protein